MVPSMDCYRVGAGLRAQSRRRLESELRLAWASTIGLWLGHQPVGLPLRSTWTLKNLAFWDCLLGFPYVSP